MIRRTLSWAHDSCRLIVEHQQATAGRLQREQEHRRAAQQVDPAMAVDGHGLLAHPSQHRSQVDPLAEPGRRAARIASGARSSRSLFKVFFLQGDDQLAVLPLAEERPQRLRRRTGNDPPGRVVISLVAGAEDAILALRDSRPCSSGGCRWPRRSATRSRAAASAAAARGSARTSASATFPAAARIRPAGARESRAAAPAEVARILHQGEAHAGRQRRGAAAEHAAEETPPLQDRLFKLHEGFLRRTCLSS